MQDSYPTHEPGPADQRRRVLAHDTPAQRARIIKSIARELGRSWEEVAPIYDQLYDRMARSAKVVDFLPALVLKNLRVHFRRTAG